MAHGGFRKGSGRKAGSTNRYSKELLSQAMQEGDLPVHYLLSVMRDKSLDTRLRIEAAKAAAPYLHHKLASMQVDLTVQEMTHEEWLASLETDVSVMPVQGRAER